jgi:hypothetical protein
MVNKCLHDLFPRAVSSFSPCIRAGIYQSYTTVCFTTPVPEIIDPVFVKTSQNDRFLLSENERFGLVFVKTGSINSGNAETIKSHTFLFHINVENNENETSNNIKKKKNKKNKKKIKNK